MKSRTRAADHKLGGCRSRAIHQIDGALQYLNLVTPVLPKDENDPSRQFLYQSMILMLQSFYEEYLRCVVALGTFWKAPAVRLHLADGQDDPERFALMPMAEIAHLAQERVRFENQAKKLKAVIAVVIGSGPFPDQETERQCLEFATVRNLIAHRGGLPHSVTAPIAHSSTVKVESTEIGTGKFHQLRITAQFFVDGLTGIQQSIASIETAMTKDEVLRLGLKTDV